MLKSGKYISVALIAALPGLAIHTAYALDFIENEKPNASVAVNYVLDGKDTLGGYSIYAGENDWRYYYTFMGTVSCNGLMVNQPIVFFQRFTSGRFTANYLASVTLEGSSCNGWGGDPCGGDKIIKINRVRGRLDRCATSELTQLKVRDEMVDVLKLHFVETNSGSRLYENTFNISYKNLNIPVSAISDRYSDFNKKLSTWMERYLDAVVIAGGLGKLQNAFANIDPLFSFVFDEKASEAKTPAAAVSHSLSGPSARLKSLMDSFDAGSIRKDEYERKKKEILDSM